MVQAKEPVIERITELVRKYPSRSAAARAWGININTLKSYYRKDVAPPVPRENLLARIAEREGISLEWLISGDEKSPITTGVIMEQDRLTELLAFLTEEERRQLTSVIARKGVEVVLYLLDEDNIRLMQLDAVVKEKILGQQSNAAREVAQNSERSRECDPAQQEQSASDSLASNERQAG